MAKINTGYIQNLVSDYRNSISASTEMVDVITFAEASWGLKFDLFPMQRFILKTFYGLPLDDGEKVIPLRDELNTKTLAVFTEREMMEFLIENKRTNILEYKPGQSKKYFILCCGRRASKTNITSIICGYESYRMVKLGNPQAYFGQPDGNEIAISTVATVDEHAAVLYNLIKNRISSSSFFTGRVDGDTKVFFSIKTDSDMADGRGASVCVYCGGAGSKALRGKNNIVVVIDEAAHFDNTGPGSLQSCWAALEPSTANFVPKGKSIGEGKVIMLSSPLARSGTFYEKCQKAYDDPEDYLLFKMYSSMINIGIDQVSLRTAYKENKEMFRCEYGGEFSDTISSWISPDTIDKVTDKSRTSNRLRGESGLNYYMGIDYGGKNDGTSLAICHKEGETIVLDLAEVFYASNSDVWTQNISHYKECNRMFSDQDVLPLNKLADYIKSLCENFNVVGGWFDQYNGYGLLELLKERGLQQFSMKVVSQQLNVQTFQIAKELMNTEKLILFASLEECKEGSSVVVQAPQRKGFHDDISDAFVRAVYMAYNDKTAAIKRVTSGTGLTGSTGGGLAAYKSYQLKKLRMHGGEFYRNYLTPDSTLRRRI